MIHQNTEKSGKPWKIQSAQESKEIPKIRISQNNVTYVEKPTEGNKSEGFMWIYLLYVVSRSKWPDSMYRASNQMYIPSFNIFQNMKKTSK